MSRDPVLSEYVAHGRSPGSLARSERGRTER
jgi:hypothetical protein